MNTISLIPLSGIPAVSAGSDLTAVLLTALEDIAPREGDLLVLTHKVLSKANGLTIALSDVRPSAQAEALSRATGKDPRLMEVILENCNTVYACDRGILIAERRDGWVCCNAGVDAAIWSCCPVRRPRARRIRSCCCPRTVTHRLSASVRRCSPPLASHSQ